MWVEVSGDLYLQDRREILKNKYLEAGVNFLEGSMESSWWEWLVRSRCSFWVWPREFWGGIRYR